MSASGGKGGIPSWALALIITAGLVLASLVTTVFVIVVMVQRARARAVGMRQQMQQAQAQVRLLEEVQAEQQFRPELFAERELQWQCFRAFAHDVSQALPGAAILLLTPDLTHNEPLRTQIQAFKEALTDGTRVVATVSVEDLGATNADEPDLPPLLSAAFDQALAEHPECDAVFSLAGLPWDVQELALWERPLAERPRLLLKDVDLSSSQLLHHLAVEPTIAAVMQGRLDAPQADMPAEAPDDPHEAFAQRYLLVTPDNVLAQLAAHPRLFGYTTREQAAAAIAELERKRATAPRPEAVP